MLNYQTKQNIKNKQAGFTLTEVLIVIGLIAILAGLVIIAINPARQFAQANNTQRASHINTILNAIGQNIAENKGHFECSSELPESAKIIKAPAGDNGIDLRACLVPDYLSELPVDPKSGTAYDPGTNSYNTDYSIMQSESGRITIEVLKPELNEVITVTR